MEIRFEENGAKAYNDEGKEVGLCEYYEKDGKLFFDVRDPDYLEMVKYMNGLYRDGLLDKEWAVNKEQIFTQKAGSGRVAATQEKRR